MSASVQFIQTTPDELETKILKGVQSQIDDLKKNFQLKEPNEYYTRQGLALKFDVDLSTIFNWTKKGILKPHGIGGRVYFLRSEVEASVKPLSV